MVAHPFGVIFIEDDGVDAEALSRSLLRLASPPHLAIFGTATEALQALQDQRPLFHPATPFLILLDLHLPGMSALEFLADLRKDARLKRCIVFVLADSDRDSDRTAAYDMGVAGYLRKSAVPSANEAIAALLEIYMQSVTTLVD
ncbi:MAG: response regulator [Caldilineaceae bacterium]